jgi:ABC-2 type transport system ATP-binding protein
VNVIEAIELRKTYRSGWFGGLRSSRANEVDIESPGIAKGTIHALRGVSLTAGAGDVFGLLGPNGAGKTTLIKTLLGIIQPTSGTASLLGNPIGSQTSRARVGYLPESLRIDRHHTARSALAYYGRLSRMDSTTIARRSDELLELVGLRGRDRESVRRFSKGMYQRLGIAQALMHNPDLLILDEPTDGLDPIGRNDVRRIIEQLQKDGKTIFLNSHILQEVELVCTQVAIMVRGKIRALGPIDSIANQMRVDAKGASQVPTANFGGATIDGGATNDLLIRVDCLLPHTSVASRVLGNDSTISASLHEYFDDVVLARESLPGWNSRNITALAGGATQGVRVIASLPDQAAVDRLIDRIRSANVSIRAVEVKRPTLEDIFIQLVNQPEEDLR